MNISKMSSNHSCIICSNEFLLDNTSEATHPYALICCGHVFHKNCLSTWLAQSQSCPVCRRVVQMQQPFMLRLYLHGVPPIPSEPATVDHVMKLIEGKFNALSEKNEELKRLLERTDRRVMSLEQLIARRSPDCVDFESSSDSNDDNDDVMIVEQPDSGPETPPRSSSARPHMRIMMMQPHPVVSRVWLTSANRSQSPPSAPLRQQQIVRPIIRLRKYTETRGPSGPSVPSAPRQGVMTRSRARAAAAATDRDDDVENLLGHRVRRFTEANH